jgi:Rieske Fe-S protein
MDRRRFVELSAALLAGVALPGCASVAATRVVSSGGAVRLSLADHPQLARSGGYLKVQPEGATTPIYVLTLEDGSYAALSPICTHRGCTVDVEGEHLVCPCHGSTYDRGGRVLRGPAEQSLERFRTRVSADGSELFIQLESER